MFDRELRNHKLTPGQMAIESVDLCSMVQSA